MLPIFEQRAPFVSNETDVTLRDASTHLGAKEPEFALQPLTSYEQTSQKEDESHSDLQSVRQTVRSGV